MAGFLAGPQMWEAILRGVPDREIRRPLWDYPPSARKAIEHERARRGILRIDLEPIGDPEYS